MTIPEPTTPTVRPATPQDVPRAVETLARAFLDYPATRHTLAAENHAARVREAQELLLTRVGLEYGRVWVTEDGSAVAVWTTQERDPGPAFAAIGPRMAELSGDRLAAQQESERLIAPHRPTDRLWNLARDRGGVVGGVVLRVRGVSGPGRPAASGPGIHLVSDLGPLPVRIPARRGGEVPA